MTDTREPESTDSVLDDLRRRLYRSDATDDDLRRYVEARESGSEVPPQPEHGPPPPPPRRLVLGLALAAVLAAGAAVAVAAQIGASSERAAPAARTTAGLQESGAGADGASSVAELGSVAGLGSVAASIGGTAAVGQRFQGYGDAVVPIDAPEGSGGGRASIDVISTDPARVGWQALLRIDRDDGTSYPYVLAEGAAEDRSGAHAPTVFAFASRPLTQVAVEAPPGVGWTLVVAFTPEIAPVLCRSGP